MHRSTSLLFAAMLGPASADPIFPNSVVSNDIDFIREDDPEAGFCLNFVGTSRAEMPDKRTDISLSMAFLSSASCLQKVTSKSGCILT